MWKRYILPSAVLLALAIFPAMLSASAEPFITHQELEHKDITLLATNPDGSKTYRMTPVPSRIWDDQSGIFAEYILSENSQTVRLETGNAGSIEFNKNTCSYNLHKSGYIDELNPPELRNLSWTVKGKAAGASTWSSVNTVNNAACAVTVQATDSTVRIIGERSASSGIFQIVLDYSPGKGIKETFRAYNNNPAWNNHNIGFTETMEVPRVIQFGNRTYDLANHNGTVLDRNWIENNDSKILSFTENTFYDFGIGFDSLNDVKIMWDGTTAKLALNYLYPTVTVPYQTWFEVDPVFNFAATSGDLVCNIEPGQSKCGQLISDTTPQGFVIQDAVFYIATSSSPTGQAFVEVRRSSDNGLVATSSYLNIATVTGVVTPYTFTFNATQGLIPSETFRIAVSCPSCTAGNKIALYGTAASSVANQQMTFWTGATWTNTASDARGSLTYTIPPPNPPTNLVANSQARKVQYTWTQADGSGITTYYLGRSLDNSTWPQANKTSTGNVTSYLDSAYYRAGLLYYVNVTAYNGANSTSAFSSFTMDTKSSAPQDLARTLTSTTSVQLTWSAPASTGGDAITGYRVERAPGYSCTGSFSTLVNSTASLNYNNTGLSTTDQYCYRVAAWNGVGMSDYSGTVLRFVLPDAVTDLQTTSIGLNNIDIAWTQPGLNGGTLLGYRINYTTPSGTPNTILVNNTNSSSTAYSITGLTDDTAYCMRVGAWTYAGNNGSGNIVCATTFGLANFTIGFFDVNQTNSDIFPIRFERSELNSTATNVKVIYPNTADLDCSLYFTMAQDTLTYNNINGSAYDVDSDSEDFVFAGSLNDVVDIRCVDSNTNDTATYVLQQQGEFVLLDMIRGFRNGDYGTSGMFGALDLVTLIVVISSMIGFNRVNEAVGAVFNTFLIGTLAWFQIITFPAVMFSALFIIALFAYLNTRKD